MRLEQPGNQGLRAFAGKREAGIHSSCQEFRRYMRKNMSLFPKLFAGAIAATVMTSTVATAQNLEVKRYNPSEWTKTFLLRLLR
jgi:hypothetical protein